MSIELPIRLVLPSRKSLLLPAIAIFLALVFVITLHPASGSPGGVVFLLAGWAIPSVINLLLAAWIVTFFRAFWSIRVALFLVASFVLGVNVSLPELFTCAPQSVVSFDILRPIAITSATPLDDRLLVASQTPLNSSFAPSPFGMNVNMDEGCMCMYFVYGGRGYYDLIQGSIYQVTRLKRDHKFYFFDRLRSPDGVHFDVEFTPSTAADNAVDVAVNIYDGIKRTATYSQYNLPVPSLDTNSIGRTRPLMNDHFYEYSASMLLHRNFWMWFFEAKLSDRPITPFKSFLSRALQVT